MMSDSTCTAPLPLRLEASDDRPCHDKAAREIVRQARKRALAYYQSVRKTQTKKETDR